jgi:16S rRNA (cytosine967-C5)-methyltransferase
MTPAARVQAAIEILDLIQTGKPVEQVLTGWARRSRYAGSSDRAAVRDHVFDVLRRMRSFAALGGGNSGRRLMLGALRQRGEEPDEIFCDLPHAPAALSDAERAVLPKTGSDAERLDIPDWLWSRLTASLGAQTEAVAQALQHRAPLFLRANLRKTSREDAIRVLAHDGVICAPHPVSSTALQVTQNGRRIRQSLAYRTGLVELQDGASQAVVAALPLRDGMRVLDYCAGGGGKSLAMAAQAKLTLFAHDSMPGRMRDLDARADRAAARIVRLKPGEIRGSGRFDLVLCDVPCSGSGAWRRAPEGKWRLTPERLEGLKRTQVEILCGAAGHVAATGVLAYATCSVLAEENDRQIEAFLRANPAWELKYQNSWPVQAGTDGFYTAHLTRAFQT